MPDLIDRAVLTVRRGSIAFRRPRPRGQGWIAEWRGSIGNALACPIEGGREALWSPQIDVAPFELFENASTGGADVQTRLDFREMLANAAGEGLCETGARVQGVISWDPVSRATAVECSWRASRRPSGPDCAA